ncbi:MAG: calcium-translocating P-type ATPase, PMCA-type [Prevotella sp.]|jgi:Ca2+-transporting ATPase
MTKEHTRYDSARDGLDDKQVAESRQLHGTNVLTPPQRASLWKLYLDKYRDPIIRILLVAAGISLILAFVENDFMETIGIILAIFLATTIGFYFERDAMKKFNLLVQINEDQPVKVRRNGHVTLVPRRDVVVGDIILVETGDEIPADAQLIKATNLQVNESSLTGEILTSKHVGEPQGEGQQKKDAYPADLILRSTMVMSGHGEARVVAVGDSSEIGKVAQQATEISHTKTPLNQQLDKLASLISKVGSGVAVAAFVIFLGHDILTDNVWHGSNYFAMAHVVLNYFMMAVTLIVMAVPEGLPMAVTLSLALNMRRMLQSNILVRKLHASETMGAVTVICTDKTGTLTQNQMQVANLLTAQQLSGDTASTSLLHQSIALNTTAELDGERAIGNPTEGALLLWLRKDGGDYTALRSASNIIDQLPFSTERKMMSTTIEDNGRRLTFVKGAPEVILNACQLSKEERAKIDITLLRWQHQAMRTLAIAYREGDFVPLSGTDGTSGSYIFQAIVAIADPIREDVPAAVNQCRGAGIEVKMVTGDTYATAAEIARQIGMGNISEERGAGDCISGTEFESLSDEEAAREAKRLKVMYRARPTDKQRLVKLLQQQGQVVAVTGDGTNDAPALNHAHVGLSLGSGTSVAKEASDITLLDDSFGAIVNGVMWGRSLYRNIQRFLFFQLVVNVTALLLVLGGSIIGTEMPLTVTQILWVNLIMDTFAALALASLPPSRETLKESPRRQTDFIITHSMGRGILFCGIFFSIVMMIFLYWCERHGAGSVVDVHELTIFFTTFVMLQFWNLFNAKCLGSNHSAFRHLSRDYGMLFVLAMILLGQWLIVTFGGKMFRTDPLSWREWLTIIVVTSPVLWIGELWRLFKRISRARV